jgi:Protein of unknown function (DUF3048) N-terminal domain/Protein of unknown function (DUF3048) C-terminal domain
MHASILMRLLMLLSVAVLISSCGGQSGPAAPTAAPAATAAPEPTAVPAPTAPPAPTEAPAATAAPAPTEAPAPTAAPAPTEAPAAPAGIQGSLVRGSVTQRPYVVMIDNHPNAYPQSGLDKAVVVFEALAEFGLTRFMAVYAPESTPATASIGPVRSTRLYFAQWSLPFSALYVHAGGSPQGLALVESSQSIVNIDALFRASGAYFQRDAQRPAPHNLYTSGDALAQASAANPGSPIRQDIGFLYKEEAPAAQRPAAQTISYFFLYREDSIGWVYDPATNSYGRLRRGRPAVDAETGAQLVAKSVVVMEVKEEPIAGDDKGRIEQQVIGSGKARVFVDGAEREVTWTKPSPDEPLIFVDSAGEEIRFNPGALWIIAIPSLDNLSIS